MLWLSFTVVTEDVEGEGLEVDLSLASTISAMAEFETRLGRGLGLGFVGFVDFVVDVVVVFIWEFEERDEADDLEVVVDPFRSLLDADKDG